MQILITGYRAPDNPDPRVLTCACGEQHNLYPPSFQPAPGQGERWQCGECGAFIEPQAGQSYGGKPLDT